MARWIARVEFLLGLSVIELLFLSLMVEALQAKMCQSSLPSGGVGHLEVGAKILGGRGRPPTSILIPLVSQLIALQLCRLQFLYNETLQQTFRPVLSKLSKRRQIWVLYPLSQLPRAKKGHSPLIFGPCLLWPNGWMHQHTTWYGGRPQPR